MGTVALTHCRGFALLPAVVSTLALAVTDGLAGQQPSAAARTPDVHFVPTDTTKVREMLTAAQVGSKDLVYDLGCGDGRIVISAVKQYGARGVCVDIDPVRIEESRSNADTAGVTNRIEFIQADLFETDLSKATVVTLYLLPSLNQRLRPKLFKELRPGTRIVSNAFDMGDWKADRTLNIKTFSGSQSYAYLWIIPADVSGEWRLKPEGGSGKEYTLDLKQKYQEVSGTASSGGKAMPLSSLSVKGDRLSFVLRDGAGEGQGLELTGQVNGDRASGTAKGKGGGWSWTAVRTKPGSRPEPAGFAAAAEVTEWTVPWGGTRPRDPYVDGKGRVWFVGQQGNYVAYLEPKSGKFERYEIDEGTHPHNLVVAPDGMVWFTGNRNGRLVKLDPATRKLTNFPMPDPKVDDPHTMILDRAGNAWFTAQNSAVVGRLDAKTGKIRLWPTGGGTRPYGIEADADQRPWFVLFGTNEVGTIDPATMEMRRFTLPEGARPRRLVVTGDAIWYGDYARGYLGRLDPVTGKVWEFVMPAGTASLPYAMAGDDKGKVWLAETGVRPNRLVAFDPQAGGFSDSVATEGGEEPNTIRHMVFHKPSREIWYGTDRNTVGRVRPR